MFRSRKVILALSTLVLSFPVVVFFQNCGQAGQIQTSQLLPTQQENKISSDSLVVIQPTEPIEDNYEIHLDDPKYNDKNDKDSKETSSAEHHDSEDKSISASKCQQVTISDIMLNIDSVRNHGANESDLLEVIENDKSITLDKLTLKVRASKSEKVKELFLVLNEEGNKILSSENQALELKTPSAQQSGLKVKLDKEIQLKKDSSYNLELVINPAEQILSTKTKCIFKPVVHEAHLSENIN